jgi:hypothetical protein
MPDDCPAQALAAKAAGAKRPMLAIGLAVWSPSILRVRLAARPQMCEPSSNVERYGEEAATVNDEPV